MRTRTLYIITRTRVLAKVALTLAAPAVLLLSSCAHSSVITEIPETHVSTDLLLFTCKTQDNEKDMHTKASQMLTSGFKVYTYKSYGQSDQFTVMDGYNVEYKTTGSAWDGNVRPYWDYTHVDGQLEKYWDYSHFPYRFHAVAPYPSSSNAVRMDDKNLTIAADYRMQTSLNGLVTPQDAEPYIVAQMQRNSSGQDYDKFVGKEINGSSYTLSRYVELPFHHLNAKVRFGIYSVSPWTTDNPLYIEGLTISVYSPDFVTQANGYKADGTSPDNAWYRGAGNSGFTGLTKVQPSITHTEILRFDGGKEINDNDLSLYQGRASAYWLQCQQGIQQIPQENVALCVSFNLYKMDGTLFKTYTDIPIQMEDGTRRYDWASGYIYTYYLIIGGIEEQLEITFTATLTPWEDVTGVLSTDLEQ